MNQSGWFPCWQQFRSIGDSFLSSGDSVVSSQTDLDFSGIFMKEPLNRPSDVVLRELIRIYASEASRRRKLTFEDSSKDKRGV